MQYKGYWLHNHTKNDYLQQCCMHYNMAQGSLSCVECHIGCRQLRSFYLGGQQAIIG